MQEAGQEVGGKDKPCPGAFDGTTEPPALFMRRFRGMGRGGRRCGRRGGNGPLRCPVMVDATVMVEAR